MEPGYSTIGGTPPAQQTNYLLWGGIFLVILILVGVAFHYGFRKSSNPQNVNDKIVLRTTTVESNAASLGQKREGLAAVKKKEGFANATGKSEQKRLLSLQPFSVKQAGYIGPVKDGVFDEKNAIIQSLKAGIRTFVFQIDYHEDATKGAPLFPPAGDPCLLMRDSDGTMLSLNSGSIKKVCEAIAQYGFSDVVVAKSDPILIVLYGLRAPDRITKSKEYLTYCSKIAKQLTPLAPFHLGLTPVGDYHRQALAGQIFVEPFQNFEKKVIILSNFETSLFQNMKSLGMPPFPPSEDLDYWVNAQIFKEDEKAVFGVTSVAPAKKPLRAAMYDYEILKGLTGDARTTWATQRKGIFTMVLPPAKENPDFDTIQRLTNELGVNVIPLDIFSFDTATTKRVANAWSKFVWKEKPVALL
jgi:hypothetical protein